MLELDNDATTILRPDGTLAGECPVDDAELLSLYRDMLKLRTIDNRMVTLQRQGRIGFYGPATGHEAAVVGACRALEERDWIFPALRESAMTWLRGMPLQSFVDQLFGNRRDAAHGRQMPCHHTFREGNYVSLSAVIGTQLPQAVGAALAARARGDDVVVVGFLGDGASSSGDFHAAANFAGVFRPPLVLFCQNNQWAISVPFERQTASDGVAVKASAYGIDGVRVDGNDILGVLGATRAALGRARSGAGPTLIEALTYRVGPHTTSDDPRRYRDETVTEQWKEERDPLRRLEVLLEAKELLREADRSTWVGELEGELRECIASAEAAGPPALSSMVDDVYAEPTALLEKQRKMLLERG